MENVEINQENKITNLLSQKKTPPKKMLLTFYNVFTRIAAAHLWIGPKRRGVHAKGFRGIKIKTIFKKNTQNTTKNV